MFKWVNWYSADYTRKKKTIQFLTFYQEQDGSIKVSLKLLTVYKWQIG